MIDDVFGKMFEIFWYQYIFYILCFFMKSTYIKSNVYINLVICMIP